MQCKGSTFKPVMLLLYRATLWLYRMLIRLAALAGNAKAQAWIDGRKGWRENLKAFAAAASGKKTIWMHCASLGEYEQGRPVLDALRSELPDARILLTFFSPSGYLPAAKSSRADLVCYLPADAPRAATDFVALARPDVAVFVRYEFWYFFLRALRNAAVPTVLLAASFRPDQIFFRAYGGMFRRMLRWYARILLADDASLRLLEQHGLAANAAVTGDTRFDRVTAILQDERDIAKAADFSKGYITLVAGSTWPKDEAALAAAWPSLPADCRMIIAPHEPGATQVSAIESLFPAGQCIRFSTYWPGSTARILIIDNIGMLSRLYRYGQVAYIGGGFAKSGVHNVLEPLVYGLPVVMGPHYHKFPEAVAAVEAGYAHSANDEGEVEKLLKTALAQSSEPALSSAIKAWMDARTGATARAVATVRRLLA